MKKGIMTACILTMLFSAAVAAFADEIIGRPENLADVLTVCHMSAYYNFTDENVLNEGADKILEMGGRSIKVWFNPRVLKTAYKYNSNWPDLEDLSITKLAKTEHFKQLFNKPFTSFILNAYEYPLVDWKDGFSEEEKEFIHKEFYELTEYLLTTYKGSGKTFVISTWEGDGALKVKDLDEKEREIAYEGMAAWLNARQDAITKAREEIGMDGVKVVGAAEFNYIPSAKEREDKKFENMYGDDITFGVDTVVPNTRMDLYSFSTWGTNIRGLEESLIEKLDYYASKAPDSEMYGSKNIFLGEFGARELQHAPFKNYPGGTGDGQLDIIRNQVKYAIDWGVVYASYWTLYCNGILDDDIKADLERKTTDNSLFQGLWLIRADGSLPPVWHYFNKLFTEDAKIYNQRGETLYNPAATKDDEVIIRMHGYPIMFADQTPVVIQGRVLVPMRKLFETFNAEVLWDEAASTVTATKGETTISLEVGNTSAVINGQAQVLDVPTQLINGRTMVPVRFVGESLGLTIDWDSQTNTVIITQPADTGDGIADNLANWSKAEAHTEGWKYRKETDATEGTEGRLFRGDTAPESITYKLSADIETFDIKVFFQNGYVKDLSKLYKISVSKDAVTWVEVEFDTANINARSAERQGYTFGNLKPKSTIPSGNLYLKIDALSEGKYYSNQLSEIRINNEAGSEALSPAASSPAKADVVLNTEAVGDFISDTLANWSNVYSRTSGWKYRKETDVTEGAAGRLFRGADAPESVTYKLNADIKTFDIKVFFQSGYAKNLSKLYKISVSKDADAWVEVEFDTTNINARTAERQGYTFGNLKPKSTIPSGNLYLKIDALSEGKYYSNQISEVKIN
ncbi:MAG: copper amine oxidase N-terminal domain-containing protein [Firmicutes bacterium]|nr:copper amine oxidase N-terminal domain-containing protein [Bacillota bacterium]